MAMWNFPEINHFCNTEGSAHDWSRKGQGCCLKKFQGAYKAKTEKLGAQHMKC